jgi:hypothetical protein
MIERYMGATASYAGSDSERQRVGMPGHCVDCAQFGHVAAHPDLGCGDVGCNVAHSEPDLTAETDLHVGDFIHGFANGYFGRDSYDCRVIEEEGRDWLVTRNTRGEAELITKADARRIANPGDRSHCDGGCLSDLEDQSSTAAQTGGADV